MPARSPIRALFYHLPRTAGLAIIHDLLIPNSPWWRYCYVNYDQNMNPLNRAHEPRNWASWRRAQVRLVAGHMPFGFAGHFPGPSEYFTFLRDPVSRAVSDYYFCRNDPANPAWKPANELSLSEFVEGNYSQVQNCYARWLANAVYGARYSSEEEMFLEAMRNLKQFAFIGITEQFDRSVERLCERYGLKKYALKRAHRNASTPWRRPLSEQELSLLKHHNSLDLAIYQESLNRFSLPDEGRVQADALQ